MLGAFSHVYPKKVSRRGELGTGYGMTKTWWKHRVGGASFLHGWKHTVVVELLICEDV